ncbi:hypothetical protein ACQKEX_14510 [Bacillus pumilus]|uniref:hypothetical protein n=2 Tax=Bacillus TaxID=1386 RepID=UPI000969CE09|nr:hypothetical protein [Bacillus pumilus]MBU8576458.1 hypothetical protein [Bacillus pumilus]OLP64342.1 hypothetical protein BACPU_25670 [Bacillus pumilus]
MNNDNMYLKLKNGDKELEINIPGPVNQLQIIDGMFRFFDINIDYKEITDFYSAVGKAYSDFYVENSPTLLENSAEVSAKEETNYYGDTKKEDFQINMYDFMSTGIKDAKSDRPRYRTRYICNCGEQGNHYIYEKSSTVSCHKCKERLTVICATAFGHPSENMNNIELCRDRHGNFYLAGLQERDVQTLAD